MDLNYSFNQYRKTQVSTADQGKLILMMYDGAIGFLQQARQRLEARDIPGKGLYIGKAQSVIAELNSCLNLEKGGQIAVSLETLYLYINNQLSMANIKNSTQHIDNALRVIKELREGWRAIVNQPQGQTSLYQKASIGTEVQSVL